MIHIALQTNITGLSITAYAVIIRALIETAAL